MKMMYSFYINLTDSDKMTNFSGLVDFRKAVWGIITARD